MDTHTNENQKFLLILVTALALIVIAMVSAIFLATRRPVVIVMPGSGEATATTDSSDLTSPADSGAAGAEAPLPELSVGRMSTAPAITNPLDPLWEQIAVTEIPLTAQQVAEPLLKSATVTSVRVQATRDASRYLWRLSWPQEHPSTVSDFAQFSDAVAIQFPLAEGAPYTMGGPGMPVSILYWRAIWQKDLDEGFQDTVVSKPNAYNDFYWFAPETGPYSADKLGAENPMAKQWMIAASSGNPMADFNRKCPMENLTAHGFGTSTHIGNGSGQARGVWEKGAWYVVFEHPINETDELIKRFNQNPQQQLIAFAVWDGAAQNRGGMKSISNWIPMRINP
jgi:hypothetical protein